MNIGHKPTSLWYPVLVALLIVSGKVVADGFTEFGSKNHKEKQMVRALEAYALYKMGQHEVAFEKFLDLALDDNVQGMLNAANMYAQGIGVVASGEQAVMWYRKAAESGSEIAMLELAGRLRTGNGVVKDLEAARYWADRAKEVEYINTDVDQVNADLSSVNKSALIKAVLSKIDHSANIKSAAGVIAPLSDSVQIRITLPGFSVASQITVPQLITLWQTGFDRPGKYVYERKSSEVVPLAGGRMEVRSSIYEIWTDTVVNKIHLERYELEIEEIARFHFTDDSPKIDFLDLTIREVN